MKEPVRPLIFDRPALISDDDDFFRLALNSVLRDRLAFTDVVVTSSFDEAVERLSENEEIGLALFDLNMPGMNNWTNLRTVRTTFPEARVSVVSGSQDRHDVLTALSIGLHGYVHKGLGISEMEKALDLICHGFIYVPPFLAETAPPDVEEPFGLQGSSGTLDRRAMKSLTPRQSEILEMLVAGKSNKAMARVLGLSEGTIKFHLAAVFRVLGATNRVEAATMGAKLLQGMKTLERSS